MRPNCLYRILTIPTDRPIPELCDEKLVMTTLLLGLMALLGPQLTHGYQFASKSMQFVKN